VRSFLIGKAKWLLGLGGILLIIATTVITLISPRFTLDTPLIKHPVILLVSLMIFSGITYFVISYRSANLISSKGLLIFTISLGLALQIITIFSTPILEDDYFRYLWDRAVLSMGLSSHEYYPGQIADGNGAKAIPFALKNLAKESGEIIHRINHPQLKIIYPPIAQSAFVIAHRLKP
jgi:hypothetical protein